MQSSALAMARGGGGGGVTPIRPVLALATVVKILDRLF